MLVVDASAICAIALREPDSRRLQEILADTNAPIMSPVNAWEVSVSLERRRLADSRAWLDRFYATIDLRIVDIGEQETRDALAAWRQFGKGRHPARLNLGDCFAYALAKSRNLPLLYKGADFAKTDVRSAL